MEILELISLALAPVVFLMTYVYVKDQYDREPLKYLIITFILGIATAIPVVYIGGVLRQGLGVSHDSILGLAVYAFIVVALTEEGMKYLVLRYYNYPHKEFDEPYDGIMYGVTVSLGFAAIENVLYVMDGGQDVALLRMFTAVPAHAVFGILMGYYVGRAKYLKNGSPFLERLKGLGIAVLFHGLYDFFLFLNAGLVTLFAFVSLAIGIWLARRAIKQHHELSPHRPTDLE